MIDSTVKELEREFGVTNPAEPMMEARRTSNTEVDENEKATDVNTEPGIEI